MNKLQAEAEMIAKMAQQREEQMKLTNEGRTGRYMVYQFFGSWQLREEEVGYVPNMIYAIMTGVEGYCFNDKASAERFLKNKKREEVVNARGGSKPGLGASYKIIVEGEK